MTDFADAHPASPTRTVVRKVVVTAIAAGVVYAVVTAVGNLRDAADSISTLQWGWIAMAAGLSALRMTLYGAQVHRLTSHARMRPSVAYRIGWIVYGFGAITPASPAEGLALATTALEQHDLSRRDAGIALAFSEWFAQRTFYAVAAVNLLVAAALDNIPLETQWPLVVLAGTVITLLAISAVVAQRPSVAASTSVFVTRLRTRKRPRPPEAATRAAGREWHHAAMAIVGPPRRRITTALLSVAAVLADGLMLWATCRGAGLDPSFDLILLATTAGTVMSWIPLLPGGLGVVEVAIPTVLHAAGLPFGASVAATLAYRALGTIAPALIATMFVAPLRHLRTAASGDGSDTRQIT